MTAVLDLVWSLPSALSLGSPSGNATDQVGESINLLDGSGIALTLENGHAAWIPSNPTLKNDGVRADSALEQGTSILASAYGNVTETLQAWLVGSDIKTRASALEKLYRFAEAALNFQEGTQTAPVYLRWQADDAPAEQYALVVKIDVSFTEFDLVYSGENAELTIVIEREPVWRALPPMDNPKKWAFYTRNLAPTNSGSPAATEYNYTHLNLQSTFGGAASYRSLVQSNIRNYDEIATANVNYIDIAASLLPGDAPALALVNWTNRASAGAINATGLWVARTTRPDYYPANNNNTATQRARNTFNGNDSTITGVAVVTTKPVNANGLFGNGSVITRTLLQLAYPAGANSEYVANWSRVFGQYQNKYLAFMRASLTAGVLTEITFNLRWSPQIGTVNREQTTPVQMRQSAFGLTYLGVVELNKTQRRLASIDGTGADAVTPFILELGTTKIAGAVATVLIWDIILVPFDESVGYVTFPGINLPPDGPGLLDKTEYFGQQGDGAFSYQLSQLTPRELRGQAIELVPGVNNRLYMLADMIGPDVTVAHECRVDIVPRWYGVRDV